MRRTVLPGMRPGDSHNKCVFGTARTTSTPFAINLIGAGA